MTRSKENPVSVDELPDDPMSMPPPYWRSGGAIFHIHSSLSSLERRLKQLPSVLAKVDDGLAAFNSKYPRKSDREAADHEFHRIISKPTNIEHGIQLSSDIVCLMAAIHAEDLVNRFCVYNLHKNISEGIEKLSMTEKLVIACTSVGAPEVKGTSVFEGARKLVSWRNAFAHGHCVDRPTSSLRHNHLISPPEYPGVPSAVRDACAMAKSYLSISDYLRTKSKNSYLQSQSWDDDQIRKSLARISKYSFRGSNIHYSIIVAK